MKSLVAGLVAIAARIEFRSAFCMQTSRLCFSITLLHIRPVDKGARTQSTYLQHKTAQGCFSPQLRVSPFKSFPLNRRQQVPRFATSMVSARILLRTMLVNPLWLPGHNAEQTAEILHQTAPSVDTDTQLLKHRSHMLRRRTAFGRSAVTNIPTLTRSASETASLARFQVTRFESRQGRQVVASGVSHWFPGAETARALKGRQDTTHVALSGLTAGIAHIPVACATGYILSSLRLSANAQLQNWRGGLVNPLRPLALLPSPLLARCCRAVQSRRLR